MKQLRRRFSVYTLTMEDVELFGAWKERDKIRFTYEDTLHFCKACKRNTPLFDALTDIRGDAYAVRGAVYGVLLYEAITVDFRLPPEVDCIRCGGNEQLLPAADLPEAMYRYGFDITGVPGGPETLHFVPFVASASMARENQYLFVNRERLDALLRAVTLDMIGADAGGLPFVDGCCAGATLGGVGRGAKFISVPKLSAYVGLSMSDGVSVRELQCAARDAYRQAQQAEKMTDNLSLPEEDDGEELAFRVVDAAPDDPDYTPPLNAASGGKQERKTAPLPEPDWQETPLLNLDESNTVCVADCTDFPLQLEKYAWCWHNEAARWQPRSLPEVGESPMPAEENAALQAIFATFRQSASGEDREEYDRLCEECAGGLWEAWDRAAKAFLTNPGGFVLPQGMIPLSGDDRALKKNLHIYAFLYAAVLCVPQGECLFVTDEAEQAEPSGVRVRSMKDIRHRLRSLCSRKEERSALWNLLHDASPSSCRVMTAQAEPSGVRVRIDVVPRHAGRTQLSHIHPDSRLNRGQLYDGCGFLDDERFDRLETLMRGRLRHEGEEALNAVQIRLPWCKGLLVRFSFCEFFRQWGQQQGLAPQKMTITDVFGISRRLFDAQGKPLMQAMFTQSMFKGAGWFKELAGEGDRWAEYWRRLKVHGASLFIAGRNTPSGMESRLNYQFLTTLGLTDNELDYLTERRLREVFAAYTNVNSHLSLLTGGRMDATEEEPPEHAEENEEPYDQNGDYERHLAELLRAHPSALLETAFIRDRLDGLAQSEVIELMRGRLPVQGDVRYALPDLMTMSLWIAENLIHPGVAEKPAMSAINDLSGEHPQGCYYAPGGKTPWTERRTGRQKPVTVLRNPHYAVGEEPVLAPLPDALRAEYDRWFGSLTGCVMLPASALMTINGADCDGDRVNVCADRAVLRAIRRRAGEENRMLRQVIRRRAELTDWLMGTANALHDNRPALAEYLRLWARELPGLIPGREVLYRPQMQCSPPLLYAGSEAKSEKFSAAELSGVHLADKLWEDFGRAKDQRIGQMSLQLLDLAADAYARDMPSFEADVPARELLRAFVARYLVTASALDTALEIDMAKSGLRRADHPLKKMPAGWQELMDMGRGSAFRQWRNVYQRQGGNLRGVGFESRLADLMTEAARVCGETAGAAMPLDHQPMRVFRLWAQKAACLPQRAKGSLKPALLAPRLEPSPSLLHALRDMVISYDRQRRANLAVQQLHNDLNRRHQLAMRWLLGNGFTLPGAMESMEKVRAMLLRWQEKLAGKECVALERLAISLREESLAARWGWVEADERRRLFNAVLAECSPQMACTEQEAALLCCSRRSIAFVRLMVDYGLAKALLRVHSHAGAGVTPDVLESSMRALIAEKVQTPAYRDEVFYAVCRALYRTTYQENERRLTAVNDFTLTYLLRDLLRNRIRT